MPTSRITTIPERFKTSTSLKFESLHLIDASQSQFANIFSAFLKKFSRCQRHTFSNRQHFFSGAIHFNHKEPIVR